MDIGDINTGKTPEDINFPSQINPHKVLDYLQVYIEHNRKRLIKQWQLTNQLPPVKYRFK